MLSVTKLLDADEVRALVLDEVKSYVTRHGGRERSLSPRDVIESACQRAQGGGRGPGDVRVLESFYALFNEGVLAWGLDRSNHGMDWSHVTPLGELVLAGLDRDPANASGYLAELRGLVDPNGVAGGYIAEAVHSYNAGCDRGAAVLLGCAAEGLVLDVRDELVTRLNGAGAKVQKSLTNWKAKPVIDEIDRVLRSGSTKMPHDLAERFDVHWRSLFHHVRMARNEAARRARVGRDRVHAVTKFRANRTTVLVDAGAASAALEELFAWSREVHRARVRSSIAESA